MEGWELGSGLAGLGDFLRVGGADPEHADGDLFLGLEGEPAEVFADHGWGCFDEIFFAEVFGEDVYELLGEGGVVEGCGDLGFEDGDERCFVFGEAGLCGKVAAFGAYGRDDLFADFGRI